MLSRSVATGSGRRRTRVAVALASVALLAAMRPALAAVYQTPGREVVVGTEGEEARGYFLAASHGGTAHAHQGVAVTTTGNAWGYFTASGTGCAYSSWLLGVSLAGCASSLFVAASVLGPVVTHPISNGMPSYGASGTGCVDSYAVAVSGTGCADGGVALSLMGDARSPTSFSSGVPFAAPGVGISGTGNATGGMSTVSGTGDSSSGATTMAGLLLPSLSVSGARNASTTNTTSGVVVAPAGQAGGGAVGLAGGDANGGLVAVSTTGDACGASVYSLAPMGQAC